MRISFATACALAMGVSLHVASQAEARVWCKTPAIPIDPEVWLRESRVDPIACVIGDMRPSYDCGEHRSLDPEAVTAFFTVFNQFVEEERFDICHRDIMWWLHRGDLTRTQQFGEVMTEWRASENKLREIRLIMQAARDEIFGR